MYYKDLGIKGIKVLESLSSGTSLKTLENKTITIKITLIVTKKTYFPVKHNRYVLRFLCASSISTTTSQVITVQFSLNQSTAKKAPTKAHTVKTKFRQQ